MCEEYVAALIPSVHVCVCVCVCACMYVYVYICMKRMKTELLGYVKLIYVCMGVYMYIRIFRQNESL
jgi:hypothetical protein